MSEFDPGPSANLAKLFDEVPDPPALKEVFWADWGPIFYRGRLDGSARVLCLASDPGPTERVAGRTLVGDAGQRVQGFLAKLGITHSYLCLNAWAYPFRPSAGVEEVLPELKDPGQLEWRNKLYDAVTGPALEAIVAFGYMAKGAVEAWEGKPEVKRLSVVAHPSHHTESVMLDQWRKEIPVLRGAVTPDPDGDNTGPSYGAKFEEADYAAIPRRDLPFGAPDFLGDDAWVRAEPGAGHNSVNRPADDDMHTLIWRAPKMPA